MQAAPLQFLANLFSSCQKLNKSYLIYLPPVIIIVCSIFQVVRYHSLVIDSESLPEVLIPIAWTSSTSTLPFIGPKDYSMSNAHGTQTVQSIFVDSFSAKVGNGTTRSERVLMGIKHSTRPQYGVQVLCTEMICL